MGTPHLTFGCVFQKFLEKWVKLMTLSFRSHGHIFENDVIFSITSQAVQILRIGLLFDIES